MKRATVVTLLQGPATGYTSLDALASEFGWSVRNVAGMSELRDVASKGRLVAVLFDSTAGEGSWASALRSVQETAPEALAVVCHTSSERIPWPELAEAGAFHALLLPLHPTEVRQSLAFICAAQTRRRQIRTTPSRRHAEAVAVSL